MLGLGRGVVNELARLRAQFDHLALIDDDHTLPFVDRNHRAVGQNVVLSLGVGAALVAGALLPLGRSTFSGRESQYTYSRHWSASVPPSAPTAALISPISPFSSLTIFSAPFVRAYLGIAILLYYTLSADMLMKFEHWKGIKMKKSKNPLDKSAGGCYNSKCTKSGCGAVW